MYIYRLVLLLVIGMYLFSPAIMDGWVAAGNHWFQPWILWFAVLVISFAMQPRSKSDEL